MGVLVVAWGAFVQWLALGVRQWAAPCPPCMWGPGYSCRLGESLCSPHTSHRRAHQGHVPSAPSELREGRLRVGPGAVCTLPAWAGMAYMTAPYRLAHTQGQRRTDHFAYVGARVGAGAGLCAVGQPAW
jgi:hypothetical protein